MTDTALKSTSLEPIYTIVSHHPTHGMLFHAHNVPSDERQCYLQDLIDQRISGFAVKQDAFHRTPPADEPCGDCAAIAQRFATIPRQLRCRFCSRTYFLANPLSDPIIGCNDEDCEGYATDDALVAIRGSEEGCE